MSSLRNFSLKKNASSIQYGCMIENLQAYAQDAVRKKKKQKEGKRTQEYGVKQCTFAI